MLVDCLTSPPVWLGQYTDRGFSSWWLGWHKEVVPSESSHHQSVGSVTLRIQHARTGGVSPIECDAWCLLTKLTPTFQTNMEASVASQFGIPAL